jgi:hypothetical protein
VGASKMRSKCGPALHRTLKPRRYIDRSTVFKFSTACSFLLPWRI